MTRIDFDPKWVFFERVPCAWIDRCGKTNLFPAKHPFAPEYLKLFAKGLCTSCWFAQRRISEGVCCAECKRFIFPSRMKGVPSGQHHQSRQLCRHCYMRAKRCGTLDNYPKVKVWRVSASTSPMQERVEIARSLRGQGFTNSQIASRMGLCLSTVERYLSTTQSPSRRPRAA